MTKLRLLFLLGLLVFGGCKKDQEVNSMDNIDISVQGDIITIGDSPVVNPEQGEILGFMVRKKDLDYFNKQLVTNQYSFKTTKGDQTPSFDRMWRRIYTKYLLVARSEFSYNGGLIALNITTGNLLINKNSVRMRSLDYIFTEDKKIPMGSGVATMLGAKKNDEYYLVWILLTYGTTDEHDFSVITHLNKDFDIQEKSIYMIS